MKLKYCFFACTLLIPCAIASASASLQLEYKKALIESMPWSPSAETSRCDDIVSGAICMVIIKLEKNSLSFGNSVGLTAIRFNYLAEKSESVFNISTENIPYSIKYYVNDFYFCDEDSVYKLDNLGAVQELYTIMPHEIVQQIITQPFLGWPIYNNKSRQNHLIKFGAGGHVFNKPRAGGLRISGSSLYLEIEKNRSALYNVTTTGYTADSLIPAIPVSSFGVANVAILKDVMMLIEFKTQTLLLLKKNVSESSWHVVGRLGKADYLSTIGNGYFVAMDDNSILTLYDSNGTLHHTTPSTVAWDDVDFFIGSSSHMRLLILSKGSIASYSVK